MSELEEIRERDAQRVKAALDFDVVDFVLACADQVFFAPKSVVRTLALDSVCMMLDGLTAEDKQRVIKMESELNSRAVVMAMLWNEAHTAVCGDGTRRTKKQDGSYEVEVKEQIG